MFKNKLQKKNISEDIRGRNRRLGKIA